MHIFKIKTINFALKILNYQKIHRKNTLHAIRESVTKFNKRLNNLTKFRVDLVWIWHKIVLMNAHYRRLQGLR